MDTEAFEGSNVPETSDMIDLKTVPLPERWARLHQIVNIVSLIIIIAFPKVSLGWAAAFSIHSVHISLDQQLVSGSLLAESVLSIDLFY